MAIVLDEGSKFAPALRECDNLPIAPQDGLRE